MEYNIDAIEKRNTFLELKNERGAYFNVSLEAIFFIVYFKN